ncbi:MAG TPA: hypothetical protein VGF81_17315 [Solirubrobacteraceae bacterium]|jgi:hypothetical protein
MSVSEDPAPEPKPAANVAPTGSTASSGGSGQTVGGAILAGIGGLLLIGAIALVVIHLTQRSDGYYTSSTLQVASSGYAVTSEGLEIGSLPSFANDIVGRVRVTARSTNGRPLFVGIAPQQALNAYLGNVARSRVTDISDHTASYKTLTGGPPAGPPGRQSFWQASSSGGDQVSTAWDVKEGDWAIVLMNASGAPAVSAAVVVGAKTNILLWVGLGLFVVGLIFGGAGVAMLVTNRSR